MEYEKVFAVEGAVADIRQKLTRVLQDKKFTVEIRDDILIAQRGSVWAQVWAFDITKYKTRLEIRIEDPAYAKKKVIFRYEIATGAAIPVASDQKKLDAEMDALLGG